MDEKEDQKEQPVKQEERQQEERPKRSEMSHIVEVGGAIFEALQDLKSTLNNTNYNLASIARTADIQIIETRDIERKIKELNNIFRDIRDELHISNILACKDIILTVKDQNMLKELEERILLDRKNNKKTK